MSPTTRSIEVHNTDKQEESLSIQRVNEMLMLKKERRRKRARATICIERA